MGTFNSDAIKDGHVLEGGFPARYGRQLSFAINLTVNGGNMKRYAGTGFIGFLASLITPDGPIKRDRSSFLVFARRHYSDLLIRSFLPDEENYWYYFSDLNPKTNVVLNKNSRIYFSSYWGRTASRNHPWKTYRLNPNVKAYSHLPPRGCIPALPLQIRRTHAWFELISEAGIVRLVRGGERCISTFIRDIASQSPQDAIQC